ncbi:MAG: rhomboid family intramembrane serine protease [Pirellulales bacterium]|nr:rhomboid family intramembrane serine protease [Pirellulales bacterium]
MGIYDRDYYQQEDTPQRTRAMRQLRHTSVTNKLLLANIIVYLICWLICYGKPDRTAAVYAALDMGSDFFDFDQFWQIWRLLSYGFMHSPFWEPYGGIWHILMNGFGLWMFGRFIEQRYGGVEFLRFYLIAIVFSGLVYAITNFGGPGAVGASGAVVAIVILFCFLYPHEKLLIYGIFPVPAWVVGILYVGFDIYTAINQANGADSHIAWQAHLGGAGFAAAYYLLKWDFAFLSRWFSTRSPKLTVYREHVDSVVVEDEPSAETQLIAQGEAILKQLHEKGETSLTARQHKTLERYSELLQQRRGRDDGQYKF